MTLAAFEVACLLVIAATLAAMARTSTAGWRALAADYAALAVAGWLGEESMVALYEHYRYADGWHARLHHVPALVPLIWPLVILSARQVASSLWPGAAGWRPLVVGAIVAFDASMVEVLAVRAGFWSWTEPGHLGVPLIGMLGWGYFAIGAELALSRGARLATVIVAPAVAHALVVATWWAAFRWGLRRDFGLTSVAAIALIGGAALFAVIAARRKGAAIPIEVAGPRMIAAALFFAVLVTAGAGAWPLWAHTAAVALPYLAATRYARATA